jgi:hypothetical protein
MVVFGSPFLGRGGDFAGVGDDGQVVGAVVVVVLGSAFFGSCWNVVGSMKQRQEDGQVVRDGGFGVRMGFCITR